MKYRSKPVEVEAVQFDGTQYCATEMYKLWNSIPGFPGQKFGEWIIKDGDTFSVCSDEEFKRKYEEIEK